MSTSGGSREDEYAGGAVIAATVLGLLLPSVAIVIRVLAKQRSPVGLNLFTEDYLAFAAMFFKITIDVLGIILLNNGMGKHVEFVSSAELVTFAKTQYAGSYLYTACITCAKVSILVQYKRMFNRADRLAFHWQVNLLITVIIVCFICICTLSLAICIPLDKFWTPQKPGACLDIVSFYYGLQIPNILTDAFIIICPCREVYHMEMSSKLRGGILTMLLLGTITFAFDIVRLIVFLAIDTASNDFTWYYVEPAVWTTIEPAIAIVAICLPSIRSFYKSAQRRRNAVSSSSNLVEVEGRASVHGTASGTSSIEMSANSVPNAKRPVDNATAEMASSHSM